MEFFKKRKWVKRGTLVTLNYFLHFGETIRADFCGFVLQQEVDNDFKEHNLRPPIFKI